jgi:hypothetical protein
MMNIDMGVSVKALQLIAMLGQGIKKHSFFESPRQVQVLVFSGQGVEVPKRFIHATEFSLQDSLHVLVADALLPMLDPSRHSFRHRERLIVPAVHVQIHKTRHDLVVSVQGSPDRAPLAQAIEKLFRKGAEIAVLQRLLAIGQFADQRIALVLQFTVTSAGIHQCAGGQVVASREVTAQFAIGFFPSSQGLSRGGDPGIHAEGVEEPVRRE